MKSSISVRVKVRFALVSSSPFNISFASVITKMFCLSVRYTTQPAFISSAATQAGVAAAASEEAKHNHYLESVANDGGDFIPLVCSPSMQIIQC